MQGGKERPLHEILNFDDKGLIVTSAIRIGARYLNLEFSTIKMAEIFSKLPTINCVRVFQVPLLLKEKCSWPGIFFTCQSEHSAVQ